MVGTEWEGSVQLEEGRPTQVAFELGPEGWGEAPVRSDDRGCFKQKSSRC